MQNEATLQAYITTYLEKKHYKVVQTLAAGPPHANGRTHSTLWHHQYFVLDAPDITTLYVAIKYRAATSGGLVFNVTAWVRG